MENFNPLMVVLAGVAFGLVVGVLTERSSNRRDPIYGGGPARLFHYLAASAVTAMPVTIISAAIAGGILFALIVALALAAVLWLSALIFAAIERPAREAALSAKAARGWTEEDARTSGL